MPAHRRCLLLVAALLFALSLSGCDDPPAKDPTDTQPHDQAEVDPDHSEDLAEDMDEEDFADESDGPHDPCATQNPPQATLVGLQEEYPRPTRSVTFTLRFDQPVRGLNAGHLSVDVPTVALTLGGGPQDFEVSLDGLEVNGIYEFRLDNHDQAIVDEACGHALAVPLSHTLWVDGWTHRGPITTGSLAPLQGPFFVDITEEAGLRGLTAGDGRALVQDVDGDGLEDLVVWPTSVRPFRPKVLRQSRTPQGGVRFTDVTGATQLALAEGINFVFGDVDNDGDADLFAGVSFRTPEGKLGLWMNDGRGVFTYAGTSGIASPVQTRLSGQDYYKEMAALAMADFDRDGFLDLYIGTWYGSSAAGDGQIFPPDDELYRWDGDRYEQVSLPSQHNPLTDFTNPNLPGVSRAAYGIAVGDYDNDGDLDIFVNNYGAGRPAMSNAPHYIDHNLLWRNDGEMKFTDVGVAAGVAATMRGIGGVEEESPVTMGGKTYPSPIGGNGFGCQWGDFDNDGDLDLIVGTIAHPDYPQSDRTMLHVNQGGENPVFTEESLARALEYYEDELHPVWVDVDNDGRLDLAVSRLRGGSKWEFYVQTPDHRFAKQSYTVTGVNITRPGPTLWLDIDDDGDLDFYMAKDSAGAEGFLFRNEVGQRNNWLVIDLVGDAPRDATGARVIVESATGTQSRDVTAGNGHYNTQSTRRAHFGLGQSSGASAVRIRWPDGSEEELGPIKANVRLRVTKGGGIAFF